MQGGKQVAPRPYVDKQFIYKSNTINEAIFTLNALEYRILLLLIAQVQKEHVGLRYRFYTRTVAELLGIKSTSAASKIKRCVMDLHKHTLVVTDDKLEIRHNWLISSIYYRDQGCFDLELNPNLKQYFLDLQGQFTRYKIQSVLAISDMATIRLYELLKQYERLKCRRFTFDELRLLLGYQLTQYTEPYDFKRRVLTGALKAINQKTDLSVVLEEVKEGKRVVGYQFTITNEPPQEALSVSHKLLSYELIQALEGIQYNSAGIQRLSERYPESFIWEQLRYTQQKMAEGSINCPKTYFRRRVQEQYRKRHGACLEGVIEELENLPTMVCDRATTECQYHYEASLCERLQQVGASIKQIEKWQTQYSAGYVEAQLTYTLTRAKQKPLRYLQSALKHGYAYVKEKQPEPSAPSNLGEFHALKAQLQQEAVYVRALPEFEALYKRFAARARYLVQEGLPIATIEVECPELLPYLTT